MRFSTVAGSILALSNIAHASGEATVRQASVDDLKEVFATVEPLHQLIARSRIGGAVRVTHHTRRRPGAARSGASVVADPKLALQIQTLISASARRSLSVTRQRAILRARRSW